MPPAPLQTQMPKQAQAGLVPVNFPVKEALALASLCLRKLYVKYYDEHKACRERGDKPAENAVLTKLTEVGNASGDLDPRYFGKILDSRGQAPPVYDPQEPTDLMGTTFTLRALLEMGGSYSTPVPLLAAIENHRATREEVASPREEALLDLLTFLAEKKERADLLTLVEGFKYP